MNSHGIIAAGSKYTAEAGAEILRSGGNAVDAAVAACLATSVDEASLTSLGGGGMMMVYSAEKDEVTVSDFFANGPGLGLREEDRPELDFFPVVIHFGPVTQDFYIGRGSAAVPGVIPGVMEALERWGSMPVADVIQPAVRMLRNGVPMGDYQDLCFQLLKPILMNSEENRKIFAPKGEVLKKGEWFTNPQLANTLENLAVGDWKEFYSDVIIPGVVDNFGVDRGGLVTRRDMEDYKVRYRSPIRQRYRNSDVFLNPPPAAGGNLISLALKLFESIPLHKYKPGSRPYLMAVLAAQRVAEEARKSEIDTNDDKAIKTLIKMFQELAAGGPAESGQPGRIAEGSTTHISVVDAKGNGAAVTFSHGEACGYLIGDTGITMNNMMGEADLHPEGFHKWPAGKRLATMMSPSVVRTRDQQGGVDLTMLGTGGANRIRTSILQALIHLIDYSRKPREVVSASRMHWETNVLNAEIFDLPGGAATFDGMLNSDEKLMVFKEPNIFFGGVHMVNRSPAGDLFGGGDPRRSGIVVTA